MSNTCRQVHGDGPLDTILDVLANEPSRARPFDQPATIGSFAFTPRLPNVINLLL